MVGSTVSHYKILSKLGEGGMGVVYKAEDTRLERTVALKFLAQELTRDEENRKRFLREAKAAAGINHPNVCTVHEIGDLDGRDYLALEYIDGETLDPRVAQGPFKVDDALDIAGQVADGLTAAHEKNVVHRDIKPGNLMITPDGRVKILDFGLALLTEKSKLTQLDTTVGTAAYMSPEQMQALDVDHRTDVWALGCVLYEMVAGQRAFRGEYAQAMAYEIVHEEPEPLTGLRTGVPMDLEFIVGKCLSKDREERYKDVADIAVDLKSLRKKLESGKSRVMPSAPGASRPAATQIRPAESGQVSAGDHPLVKYHVIEDLASVGAGVAYRAEDTQLKRAVTINVVPESAAREAEQRQRVKDRTLVAAVVLLMAAVAVSIALWLGGPGPAGPQPIRRFAFTPRGFTRTQWGQSAAISPNGKHIAYIAGADQPSIWVRDLDREQPRRLAGTDGAAFGWPFWSPDSQFIGFATDSEMKKISVRGGTAITLCSLPGFAFAGGTWSPDGKVIAFGADFPYRIYKVPSQGGEPQPAFGPEQSGLGSGFPQFLPGEAKAPGILFATGSAGTLMNIAFVNLDTNESVVLGKGFQPVFSPTGHILYQTDYARGGLSALPFSIETLTPTGEPFPIAEGLARPSVAVDGTLVSVDSTQGSQQLIWVDRNGRKLGAIGRPQANILYPWLSPDDRRVVVSATDGGSQDIWVHEVDRALTTRLTFDPGIESYPKWSPSGEEVVYSSSRSGNTDVFSRASDGSGQRVSLVSTALPEFPSGWSPDEKYFLYVVLAAETSMDIWYLERKKQGDGFDSRPSLQTDFREGGPRLSPDGRFVTYISDESGRFEVYVRPFPEGGGKWQVSANGGTGPRWSKDGKEVFYVEGATLMSVAVSTAAGFSAGEATPLFEHPGFYGVDSTTYDASADGQRFVLVEDVEGEDGEEAGTPSIHVIENWYEEFRERE